MRDFIEELKATDDIAGFLMDHRKETLKLGLLILGVMTALLLFLYRGGDEVDIRDTATPLGAEKVADGRTADTGSIDQYGENGGSGETEALEGVSGDSETVGNGVTSGNGEPSVSGDIFVDIGGAVKNPMLAKLAAGSRVEDAIEQAGGLKSDADITQINRAEILTDGQKIYIPKKGETVYPGSTGSESVGESGVASGKSGSAGTATGAQSGKVNINTADITQLQTLNGIGPVTAQKIIDYRTQSGSFSRIEDLKNVSGIGDKTFENMKDQITVS